MDPRKNRRQALWSWLFVCAMLALCGVLGVLQYHWIGEVTVAARDRLRGTLQASLIRSSRDFNNELAAACGALLPAAPAAGTKDLARQIAAQYAAWRRTSRRAAIFQGIGFAIPQPHGIELELLDPERGRFQPAPWPKSWSSEARHIESHSKPGGGPPFSGGDGGPAGGDSTVFSFILFAGRPAPPSAAHAPQVAWVVFDVNPQYMRDTMLPEILQRHLGTGGSVEYHAEVVAKSNPPAVIYRSDPNLARDLMRNADASVSLFDPGFVQMAWRGGGPGHGPAPDSGRWQMFVRHKAGSLEAVVAQARARSLAVTGGVLLLMMATVAALIRYTRRAQTLAQLQMDFVAGVSHELRTPLTALYTAGYNLRGKMANNPAQVERYGALVQQESFRLRQLVEQILRFATADAGRVIQEKEPVSVARIIDETLESTRPLLDQAHCVIEKRVEAELPPILGDPVALRHALGNLISNAAKYGSDGANWIGIFASRANGREPEAVEIRVADRGPGIPPDEQGQIFDSFFRGARAIQDQVHGTGLGLSLVKQIVEAHGGSIRVKSEPMRGAEFIVRIPAAPRETSA